MTYLLDVNAWLPWAWFITNSMLESWHGRVRNISLSSKYSLTELEFLRVLAQAPVRQSNKTLFGKSADGEEN